MLWISADKLSDNAIKTGELLPLTAGDTIIEQNGIAYFGNVCTDNLAKKHLPQVTQNDPFLPPYNVARYLDVIGQNHVCLLNKFPIIAPHLLVCSKEYIPQTSPLTFKDFSAWIVGIDQPDILGFFNAGPVAGSSQMHRHMQLVRTEIPLEPVILSGQLPFQHYLYQFEALDAELLMEHYSIAMAQLNRDKGTLIDGFQEYLPYNILLTQKWMLIVPRSTNQVGTLSGHGLCYSGRFLVTSPQQIDWLAKYGCMQFLIDCSYPRDKT